MTLTQAYDGRPGASSAILTGLEACGLCVTDTARILDRLRSGAKLPDVRGEIAQGALLRKRSPSGRRHVLTAVRRRFLEAPAWLPNIDVLTVALHRFTTPVARAQLLLPYLLSSDAGAFDISTGLILHRLDQRGRIVKAEIASALQARLAERHQRPWSAGLRVRWAEGLMSVLREIGALGRGKKREELLAYSVRPEVFAFHLWGQYEQGLRGAALHETPFWRLLLLHPPDARRLVGVVADRGWWKFTSAGGADEIVPVHSSLMGWLDVALG